MTAGDDSHSMAVTDSIITECAQRFGQGSHHASGGSERRGLSAATGNIIAAA